MSTDKKKEAIKSADDLISLMEQFSELRRETGEFINRYNSENYSTIWGALPTAALNADGSLGTEDAQPNTAHPIDTRIVTDLTRACTQGQLIAAVTFIMDYQKFLTNQAVSTSQRSQSVDDLAN